jgi:hypothetical protein
LEDPAIGLEAPSRRIIGFCAWISDEESTLHNEELKAHHRIPPEIRRDISGFCFSICFLRGALNRFR